MDAVKSKIRQRTPHVVLERYGELKAKLAIPLSLKRIGGHYYLYKQIIQWDKEKKKYICIETSYLGRITEEGRFKPKAMHAATDIDSAKAVIALHGGKVVLPEEGGTESAGAERGVQISGTERQILTGLTMDARGKQMELAKSIGISGRRLGYKISSLERRLGIEYVPHIRVNKLGYSWFAVFVKFIGGRPDMAKMKEELDSIANVQFAASAMNGRYDLLMCVVMENDEEEFTEVLSRIKEMKAMEGVKAEWYTSYLFITKGFIPLRDRFFEVLEKRVWNRRMGPRESVSKMISRNEYETLRAINRYGIVPFSDIERGSEMTAGSARYAYDKLRSLEVLNIVSMNMRNLEVLYNAAIIMEIIDVTAFLSTKMELFKFINDEQKDFSTNRFALVGDIGMPDGGLMIMPIMKDGDLERASEALVSKVKGIRLTSIIFTETLCGKLVYHRFDNTKSAQYNIISKRKEGFDTAELEE